MLLHSLDVSHPQTPPGGTRPTRAEAIACRPRAPTRRTVDVSSGEICRIGVAHLVALTAVAFLVWGLARHRLSPKSWSVPLCFDYTVPLGVVCCWLMTASRRFYLGSGSFWLSNRPKLQGRRLGQGRDVLTLSGLGGNWRLDLDVCELAARAINPRKAPRRLSVHTLLCLWVLLYATKGSRARPGSRAPCSIRFWNRPSRSKSSNASSSAPTTPESGVTASTCPKPNGIGTRWGHPSRPTCARDTAFSKPAWC